MRIGEIARRSGLSKDTIRFYERNGLIESEPSTDPKNSYRDYDEGLLERLDMIREAQTAGMTIADLALFIRQLNHGGQGDFDVDAFLESKIQEIELRIARSRQFLETLRATRAALAIQQREVDQSSGTEQN